MTIAKDAEWVRPKLQLLNPEQMQRIHQYSVWILEKTGVRVESQTAREIFRKSGAVRIKNDMVCPSSELIDYALQTVASSISIYDRSGKPAFSLGTNQGNDCWFGIGATNNYFEDTATGEIVPFVRQHTQLSARLAGLLPNVDMLSTVGVPSDVPADKLDLYNVLDMLANTTKPLVLLILEDKNIRHVFDLLSFLHGDIADRPFCIPYFNPVTPLLLNASTSDKMIASIDQRQPIMYSNYSMYGATTPAAESGTLALMNAELLFGLVFGQLVREGCEMILGSLPAAFHMKTMGSYYTPASYLLNLACAEMMRFYGIPHCGNSGSSNGWQADLSAAGDLWLNHLTSCIGKVGCAPFVGGNFDSMVFSPATAVLSDHIIGEARKFARGFALNDEQVNLAGIDDVGPGGNYLTSEQTLASLAELRAENPIWPSLTLDAWREQGRPGAGKFVLDRTQELLDNARKTAPESAELIRKGEEFINSLD